MRKFKKIVDDAMDKKLPREKIDEMLECVGMALHGLSEKERHELYMDLDVIVNGWKLDREQAEHYVSEMENKDGTDGGHWSYGQVEAYCSSKCLNFNNYDFCLADMYWAMNMERSDNYGIVEKLTSDTNKITEFYYELAMNFLDDKDAPEGKAKRYIYAMKD